MRRLHHLLFSPASRLIRVCLNEKRLSFDLEVSEDPTIQLPVLVEDSGERRTGLWAILDHLEGTYPEPPLTPDEPNERAETFRWLDWALGPFHERVAQKIVFEKTTQRFTGSASRRVPDMNVVRAGRESLGPALQEVAGAAEQNGYLAGRECTLGDLAVAAQLSSIDYFGEVPWPEFPGASEWYVRIKSRPCFRTLLSDRVPGQPPAPHYAELDF